MASIIETHEINQANIIARMKTVNEKVTKIKKSLGKAILERIENAALNVIGLPYEVPQDLIYFSAGLVGLGLSLVEQIRLKPHLKELKELEKQYNLAGEVFTKELSIQAAKSQAVEQELNAKGFTFNPTTGTYDPPKKVVLVDDFTEKTGLPKLLRDNNINPKLAYLAYPIGGYLGYKIFKTFKRKRRK